MFEIKRGSAEVQSAERGGWLKTMSRFSDVVENDLRAYVEKYDGGFNARGDSIVGMEMLLEEERRGIGRGHHLRTKFVEGTKELMRNLIKTQDVRAAQEHYGHLLPVRDELLEEVRQPRVQQVWREFELDQELVETLYVIKFFPVIFFAEEPEVAFDCASISSVHPSVFLNGLVDVITEFTKMTETFLLMIPDESFNQDNIMMYRARCVGVVQGIWNVLDTFENAYGGVINIGRGWSQMYKSKLRQANYAIQGVRQRMLTARENCVLLDEMKSMLKRIGIEEQVRGN